MGDVAAADLGRDDDALFAFGDLEATKRAIGPATGAILIEPIMGEGGVRVVPPEFLRALRALRREWELHFTPSERSR